MHTRRHIKISLQSTTRERLGKMATVVEVHYKREKWREKIREQVQRNALCIVLLFNLFFSSSYNHTFALTFYASSFATEKILYMFAPVPW